MKVRKSLLAVAAVLVALPGTAHAEGEQEHTYQGAALEVTATTVTVGVAAAVAPNTTTQPPTGSVLLSQGTIGGATLPSIATGQGDAGNDPRSTHAACTFRVDSTTGNNVVVTLAGTAEAYGDVAASTEMHCYLKDSTGYKVAHFDIALGTNVAAGADVETAVNRGPFTVCARSSVVYVNTAHKIWPGPTTNDFDCITP